MLDPIYHRQAFDTPKSWQAFLDYKNLPYRSVPELLEYYREEIRSAERENRKYKPPTLSQSTLETWCTNFKWVDRTNASDRDDEILLSKKREEAKALRIDRQAEAEQAQIEEFRNAMLNVGKGMVSFGSQMMLLLRGVTSKFKEGQDISDADLNRLYKVAYIYRSAVSGGIPVGQEAWAQALGIEEAIAILAKETDNE